MQYFTSTSSKKRPRSELLSVRKDMKFSLQESSQDDGNVFPESVKIPETCYSVLKPWCATGNPPLAANNNISFDTKELDSSGQSIPSSYAVSSQSGSGTELDFAPSVGMPVFANSLMPPYFQCYYSYYQAPSFLPIPQIVPPPPSAPIINPIVYDNNIDVGMSDLHYVSSDAFSILNARPRQNIRIPRLSRPSKRRTPSELIPSLLPTQKKEPDLAIIKQKEQTSKISVSDSPSVICHSTLSHEEDNGDKVFVLGFSWNEEYVPCVSENDIWVKK